MSEELLLLLEVWALLMYRLSSFICQRETAGCKTEDFWMCENIFGLSGSNTGV